MREDVVAHAGADGDHRVGGLDGGALHPRRDAVAAAELLGLPRPHRLERMRGQHVGDAVQQRGEMAGHAGVPGVRVHDGGPGRGVGHDEVGGQRRQAGLAPAQRGIGLCDERPVARRAHAVHVHLAQLPQLSNQFGDVYTRTAVDLGWIFPGHHRHPHAARP